VSKLVSKAKKTRSNGWFCKECGYESLAYLGRCPSCGSWSSLTEAPSQSVDDKKRSPAYLSGSSFAISSTAGRAIKLADIQVESSEERIHTGFVELDNVLGKGLQRGSLVLIGGDPGIGKSTLLLQVIGLMAGGGKRALYVSGEESLEQVKGRSLRLGVCQDLLFMAETELESILDEVERVKPEIIVIDSIQAVHLGSRDSFPGSPAQIRDCANLLMQLAKKQNITTIIVGHITKEGNIAGPKLLEHMVDVVLYFEGDKQNYFRLIRGVKNRFGPTDEVGLFEMHEDGLREVKNPSALFLSENPSGEKRTGTVVTATTQGNRVLLAEIQSLVAYTNYAQPKRMVNGLDYNRASQIAAILERRVGLPLSKQDIYASVVGGLTIDEPAADLALCLSIASCARNLNTKDKLIAIGEVGLAGEVRPVAKLEMRLKEAARQGFKRAIIPAQGKLGDFKELEIVRVKRLTEALPVAFEGKSSF